MKHAEWLTALLGEWGSRLWGSLTGRRGDGDLAEELAEHIRLAEDELRRRGHEAGEAARLARVQAGGATQALETLREQRGLPWLPSFLAGCLWDLRLAVRLTRARPVMALSVVVPVALAIAINSALFSVVDGLLFRPLPFHDPAALLSLDYKLVDGRPPPISFLPSMLPEKEVLHARLLSSPLVAHAAIARNDRLSPADPEHGIEAAAVDARFFGLLGLQPQLGVDFREDDNEDPSVTTPNPELARPVIVGHDFWMRHYGGSPDVLGVHELSGRRVRIVGVMPPGVKFPGETDVWMQAPRLARLPATYLRLAPGATVEQLAAQFPEFSFGPLAEAVRPEQTGPLLVLLSAAGILLFVAWVQVAALLLSRAVGRVHEVGVRLALGAGRARLVRQFGVENALLAGMAFGLAWLAAPPVTQLIIRALPVEVSHGQYLNPDLRTFVFACVASLMGLMVLTLLPMEVVRRALPLQLLRGSVGSLPVSAARLRHGLLVGQIALTALLLYLSGLAAHSFVRAATLDYGFDAENVLVFTPPNWTSPGRTREQVDADFAEHNRRLVLAAERLRSLPGVVSAVTFSQLPLIDDFEPHLEDVQAVDGRPLRATFKARGTAAGREFLEVLGARLVAGRGFDDAGNAGELGVAVVNETLAAMLSAHVDPNDLGVALPVIGRELRTRWFRGRIIGVVRDLVDSSPALPPDPQFFVPAGQPNFGVGRVLAVRALPSVAAAMPAIRTTLDDVWGRVPPRHFGLLRDEVDRVLTPFRGQATLLSLIAFFCLPLAAIGLTGALLYSVRVRTRETAIRIALGADPDAVRHGVVARALAIVGTGLVLGVAAGVLAGRVIAHQLFRVSPVDPLTMLSVAAGLLALAWLASVAPARQASRIQPAEVLRQS